MDGGDLFVPRVGNIHEASKQGAQKTLEISVCLPILGFVNAVAVHALRVSICLSVARRGRMNRSA